MGICEPGDKCVYPAGLGPPPCVYLQSCADLPQLSQLHLDRQLIQSWRRLTGDCILSNSSTSNSIISSMLVFVPPSLPFLSLHLTSLVLLLTALSLQQHVVCRSSHWHTQTTSQCVPIIALKSGPLLWGSIRAEGFLVALSLLITGFIFLISSQKTGIFRHNLYLIL